MIQFVSSVLQAVAANLMLCLLWHRIAYALKYKHILRIIACIHLSTLLCALCTVYLDACDM
jgi:hypothetical protein